jgi:hypothetical protein
MHVMAQQPSGLHILGVAVPKHPPQFIPTGHVPHWSMFPQPSPIAPHCAPSSAHVFGQHMALPQTFAVPGPQGVEPPQVSPPGHVPQSSIPQQPSLTIPQLNPCDAQVLGAHMFGKPQTFG